MTHCSTSAGKGELDTPEGVEKAARRMLDNPKAKQALDEFVSQWMRFDRVLTSTKDRRRFPQYTRETAAAMTEETRRFISDLIWNEQDFTKLFTADYGYRECRPGRHLRCTRAGNRIHAKSISRRI